MIEKIQIICGDFQEAFEGMSYESIGRLFMGLMSYAKDEEPEKHLADDTLANAFYPVLKNHIQRNEDYRCKRAENGKRGGGQFGNANATKNEQKRPKTSKNEQKRTPNLTLPNLTNNKNIYGEFKNVLLTDEEYEKVKSNGWESLIEELSAYMDSTGKKYKSHYATITAWARRREKVVPINKMSTRTDYDFSELEKQLIKN